MHKNNFYIRLRVLLLLGFLIGFNVRSFSQDELTKASNTEKNSNLGTYRYVSIKVHAGKHFYTGNSLSEELNIGYRSIDLKFGWQSSNPEHWTNKYYNSTSYGFGIYSAYVGTPGVLGTPHAIFGFINFPQGDFNKNTVFSLSTSLGITYESNHYHRERNPKNDALGSAFSAYVNVGFEFETLFNRNIDILYGIDYTHFSNGRSVLPNYGLNMLGLNLGIKYHYNKDQKSINSDLYKGDVLPARFKKQKSDFPPRNLVQRINILTAFGTVQNENFTHTNHDADNRFYTLSSYIEYQLNFNIKHGIDLGFDLFYDGSLLDYYPEFHDQFLYAYHLGYNYSFGKMLFKLDFGGYIGSDGDKKKDALWSRAAIQYKVSEWMSFHIGLKTKQGFTADWGEFGVVWHPFKKQQKKALQ